MENKARQTLDEIKEAIQGKDFASTEEVQDFVDQFMAKKNSRPVDDFLRLSSEQMHRLLHTRYLLDLNDMVVFNVGLEPKVVEKIPIVKNTCYFLSRLSDLEPLKVTQKGNLPLKFARELFETFRELPEGMEFTIRSEQDSLSVLSLRHIIKMCKWIKKEKKHFKLRFLERFCEYFGLVTIRRKKRKIHDTKMLVKKSDFFDRFIQWRI
jgi:hypothetical protein